MGMVRILIVEDDEDLRYLIEREIISQPDFELAGLCGNGAEACEKAVLEKPDIVLMDLNLTGCELDGVEAARRIRIDTDAKVVILTAFEAPKTVIQSSVRALASAYLTKSQFSMLVPTIRETAAGPTPQSHLICTVILSVLSPAEQAVFWRLMGQEVTLKSAGKTIANQQTSILHKLDLASRQELLHVFSAYLS